jgi:hypothetical protein
MTRHNAALNHQRDLQHSATVNAAIRNANASTVELEYHGAGDPADARLLRGIPAVGGRGSMGGAITGTRPDTMSWVDERGKTKRTRNT